MALSKSLVTVLGLIASLALMTGCATPGPGASSMPEPTANAPIPAGVEITWLGQSAFRIVSPGGKVIVTDPWLRTNPLTPAALRRPEGFERIDVLLVTHGHFDHIADAPALALHHKVPVRGPGDLLSTVMTLGVLPAELLPRMNKGGTVEAAPGIHVTAVRAEHSSAYVWRNPATSKDETHPGGEAIGWIIELENGFRIYHAGDTAVFGDMKLIGERYRPDVALVPIGGNFTMGPADAAWAVKDMLKPRVVIPMHYGVNPLARGTPKQFVDAMGPASSVQIRVATPGEPLRF